MGYNQKSGKKFDTHKHKEIQTAQYQITKE